MTGEIIEGTAVEVPTSAVATVQQGVQSFDAPNRDPLRALGRMTEAEYSAEVKAIIAGTNRMMQLQKDLLREDVDYGVIPGTGKPTLLQPGAERLAMFHRLIPEHHVTRTVTPVPGHVERIDIDATCSLHLGSLEGPVLQTSHATSSSYEDRYRWRTLERSCPTCGKPAIIKGNPKYGGGWVCWKKKDGCGTQFPDDYAPIVSQTVGKVENEEPWALLNTLVQMAQKRAFVAAVRHALGITDLFTEEIEEPRDDGETASPPQTAQAPAQQANRAAPPPQRSAAPQQAPSAPTGNAVTFEGPVMPMEGGWGLRDTAQGKKLEFAIKVGNSKHNVELWDDLARAALPYIAEGAIIRVDGRRIEQDYPNRGTKPMKKVIEGVTTVALTDAGGTRVIASKSDAAQVAAKHQAPAEPGWLAHDEGPALFDDAELPFAAAPAPVVEPVKQTGPANGAFDETGTIRNIEDRQTSSGTPYVYIELVDDDRLWVAAMSKEDADAHPAFALGQRVRLMGGWNAKGTAVVAGVMAPA